MEVEYIEPVGQVRPVVVAGHIGPVELEPPVLEPAVGVEQWYFFNLVCKNLTLLLINN